MAGPAYSLPCQLVLSLCLVTGTVVDTMVSNAIRHIQQPSLSGARGTDLHCHRKGRSTRVCVGAAHGRPRKLHEALGGQASGAHVQHRYEAVQQLEPGQYRLPGGLVLQRLQQHLRKGG